MRIFRRKGWTLDSEGGAWSDIRQPGDKPRGNEGMWLKKMLKIFSSDDKKK